MKRYSKQQIEQSAMGIYTIALGLHGLANAKKIMAEVSRMLKAETKRRKEK